MRSFVVEPMQYGRLFLAGDSAHIVPPTGAKGMNLALADVLMLSRGLSNFTAAAQRAARSLFRDLPAAGVEGAAFLLVDDADAAHDPAARRFDRKRQLAELDYVTSSEAAARSLAENYVGLPLED